MSWTNIRVTLLQLVEAPSPSQLESDLDMTIELKDENADSGVRLVFRGIHALSITKSARPFYVGSLRVSDVRSQQLEGLNYFVEDAGREFISFYCRDFQKEPITNPQ
jgi:hypothetical protein